MAKSGNQPQCVWRRNGWRLAMAVAKSCGVSLSMKALASKAWRALNVISYRPWRRRLSENGRLVAGCGMAAGVMAAKIKPGGENLT